MTGLELPILIRAAIGFVGVASGIYSESHELGEGNFSALQKAFFDHAFGATIFEFAKEGVEKGFERYKEISQKPEYDKEHLNHDLQRAARKAQLVATFFAAEYCLEEIRLEKSEKNSENKTSFYDKAIIIGGKAKNLVFKESSEKYLVTLIKYLSEEIKNIEKNINLDVMNFEQFEAVFDTYKQAVLPDAQEKVAKSLKEDIFKELENLSNFPEYDFDQDAFSLFVSTINTGWEEFPREKAVSEKFVSLNIYKPEHTPKGRKYDWFFLVCSIFNEEYKNNPKVQAAAQKDLLLQISHQLDTFGTFNIKIEELVGQISSFAGLLAEIGSDVKEIKSDVKELKEEVRKIVPQKSEPQNLVGIRELNETVYGRDEEVGLMWDFIKTGKKYGAIVAPTCFGKSYLIKKFLQTAIAGAEVKTECRKFFEKVIYLDCRRNLTLTQILQFFDDLTGKELNRELTHFFTQIQTEKVLLIFDNFECWIDDSGKYSVGENSDKSIELFINALFGANHQIHGLFVSQKPPGSEIDFLDRVDEPKDHEILKKIGTKLLQGLEHGAAVSFVETEGKSVGLNKVPEKSLQSFFEEVYYIPQAIRSMIGYFIAARGRINFGQFLRELEDFNKKEREAIKDLSDLDKKYRPTAYLIRKQISEQNPRTKYLLSLLAFFESAVPEQALHLSLRDVEKTSEKRDAVNVLVDNLLANTEEDLVRMRDAETNEEEKIIYFTLHPYLRGIIRENLPNFEVKNEATLESFAQSLSNEGYYNAEKTYFRKGLGFYECCEKIGKHLVFQLKREDLRNDLAATYMNKGNALAELQRLEEAIFECEKSVKIYQQLVLRENKLELRHYLASAYMNKGIRLKNLQQLEEALEEYEKSIAIREQLVLRENKVELRHELARAYMNKGVAFMNLQQLEEAIIEYDKAINLWDLENMWHNLPTFVMCLRNKNYALLLLKDWKQVAENTLSALEKKAFLETPSLSVYFINAVNEHLNRIRQDITEMTDDAEKAEIYRQDGTRGAELRQWIESLGE